MSTPLKTPVAKAPAKSYVPPHKRADATTAQRTGTFMTASAGSSTARKLSFDKPVEEVKIAGKPFGTDLEVSDFEGTMHAKYGCKGCWWCGYKPYIPLHMRAPDGSIRIAGPASSASADTYQTFGGAPSYVTRSSAAGGAGRSSYSLEEEEQDDLEAACHAAADD